MNTNPLAQRTRDFRYSLQIRPGQTRAAGHARWAAAMRKAKLMALSTLSAALIMQPCLAGSVVEPDAVGEWSQPTNNIRGRLLFVEGAHSEERGERTGLIFLELENFSWGETAYVYYDVLRAPPHCELRDAAGRIVEQVVNGRDAAPEPCWLTLPPYSRLRILTSYGPAYGMAGTNLIFGVGMNQTWAIPLSATNSYFLSGTFTNAVPRGETREHSWTGKLKLPSVRIPVKVR